MKEELTERERHLERNLADLSERILREEVSAETEASEATETSEATDHADLSLKMEKEDRSEIDHVDLSERILREEVLVEIEDHSQAVEDLQQEDAEDSTLQRRVLPEETSTISAMRMKAESTK